MNDRRWDAEIIADGETFPADLSRHDTLAEQRGAALREAADYVRGGLASDVSVLMFKTTKARGREYDQPGGYAYEDERGGVRVAR